MKRYIFALVLMLTAGSLFAQVNKTDLKGKIVISLYGGVNIPANGNISSDITTSEFVNPGPHFGFGVSYFITRSIGVEAVFNNEVNILANKYKLEGKQPSVAVNSFSVNGIYIFNSLFHKSSLLPYVRAGIGSYKWRHLDDTPWRLGNVVVNNGIEQKATSFGFNAGIGADYSISKNFSIGAVLDYYMYFPKDEAKYGKDFGAQGNFTPKLKLSYYIPVH